MKNLKIGIIGCGTISSTHIWAIEETEGIELAALCDINRKSLIKTQNGRDCLLFDDWKSMVKSPEIDAVAICLPHYLHAPALIDSLNAGKHVICEKPLAVNLDQLRKMKEAAHSAEKKGICSFGIFQHRYSPLIKEIIKIIQDKALGEILGGNIHFLCSRLPSYYKSDPWRGLWEQEGGGTMINQGIHTLDILFQILGLPQAAEFKLFRNRIDCIEVEDKGVGSLIYNRETIKSGLISLDFENDMKTSWQPEITLTGTGGTLVIKGSSDFQCSDQKISDRLNEIKGVEENKAPGKACYGSLHSRNYQDFISCLCLKKQGKPYSPKVSLSSQADTTEIVLALYQSHFQNKRIGLPLDSWEKAKALQYTGGNSE
jgi:predicted dehydrogenase